MNDLLRMIPCALLLGLTACLGSGVVNGGTTGSGSGTTGGDTGGSSGGTTGGLNKDTKLDGLSVQALHFGVMGDTRPKDYVNDASQVPAVYPTAVATKLFQQMSARNADFAVFTGDMLYVYNPPNSDSATAQINLFLQARGSLDRPLASALGNHEVKSGNSNLWSSKLALNAYYSFTVHSAGGDALFIVSNDSSWDSRQSAWMAQQLAAPAKWHIVVKHFPTDNTDIDQTDIRTVLSQHPPTLVLTGHEHAYAHRKSTELVLGEGGAPLSSAARGYGYAMVDELSGGALQVTVYDSGSDAQIDQWQVSP